MTNRQKILGSVSVIALVSVFGAAGAGAQTTTVDISTVPGSISVTGTTQAGGANEQDGSAPISATGGTLQVGFPNVPGTSNNLGNGVANSITVDLNDIFAESTANLTPVTFLDFNVVDGVTAGLESGTSASLQENFDNITAGLTNVDVQIDVENVGTDDLLDPGTTLKVIDNTVRTEGFANNATVEVGGNVNGGLVSTEAGTSTLSLSLTPVVAGATALAVSAQLNDPAAVYAASITDARLGVLATADANLNNLTGVLTNVTVDVDGNALSSAFTANLADVVLDLGAGDGIVLNGTAGAVNLQVNSSSTTASINNAVVEAGDTVNYLAGDQYLSGLNNSPVSVSENSYTVAATSNEATNSVSLADGLSQNGVTDGTTQANTFSTATDSTNVVADLFISNGQYTDASVLATVNVGDFNALIQNSITASDVNVNGNVSSALATGSTAVNSLDVGDATTFDSVIGVNTAQYNEGSQAANVDTLIRVEAGVAGPVVAGVEEAGVVVDSTVNTNLNQVTAQAIGNAQSTELAIDGTTISGAAITDSPTILSDRPAETGSIAADWSLLNVQVLDGASVTADITTTVDVTAADNTFDTSNLNVNTNKIAGLVIGNLDSESSLAITGNSVTGTAGVASSQTIEDGTLLSSELVVGDTAFVLANVATALETQDSGVPSVVGSNINIDGNSVSSKVYGNVVDATTNSLSVAANSISDGGFALPVTSVDRPGLTVSVDAGYALLNDQRIDDLNTAVVTASVVGDIVNLNVGSLDAVVAADDISVTGNSVTTSALLNQSTSELTLEANSLDASSSLTNVQSLTDSDTADGSAAVDVSQFSLGFTIDISASGDQDLADLNVDLNKNSSYGSAEINVATNTVSITANTQTLTGTTDSSVLGGSDSAVLNADTLVRSETSLVNDQSFESISESDFVVDILDTDVTLDVHVEDGNIADSTFDVDENTIDAYAAGNNATNKMTIAVSSFDLSAADADGNIPAIGPIATLASNQTGSNGRSLGDIVANVSDSTISIDLNSGLLDVNNITNATASTDLNEVTAFARANNVSNTLDASGTNFELPNIGVVDPAASIDPATNEIVLTGTSFGVANRQVNSVDVAASVSDTAISVSAPVLGTISGTPLSSSDNTVSAEARGSDASNALNLDYGAVNEAQGYVANLQTSDGVVTYDASVLDTEISVLTGGNVTGSVFTVSDNEVSAVSSVNSASNKLTSEGGNIAFVASDDDVFFTDATGVLNTIAGLAVLNYQGSLAAVDSSALIGGALIGVVAGVAPINETFDAGAIHVDGNSLEAQATQHIATNVLTIDAGANAIDGGDVEPGATVASAQIIGEGSDTTATIGGAFILAVTDDVSGDGATSITAEGNELNALAVGGSATNILSVDAGANINLPNDSHPIIQLDGDVSSWSTFNVVNVQQATGANFGAGITQSVIIGGASEDFNNDAVTLTDNEFSATAQGFEAINGLVIDGGANVASTGAVLNAQTITDGAISASVDLVGVIAGNEDEGSISSALNISDNSVEASASGNSATNILSVTAGASLIPQQGPAAVVVGGATDAVNILDADYAVLNAQSIQGTDISATIDDVGIGFDGFEEVTGLQNSALTVSGNEVVASAVGNEAVNQLVLNTGTYQYTTAGLGSQQTNNAVSVSASVSDVYIGGEGFFQLGPNANSSSGNNIRITGNSIGASAIGNSATNSILSGGN